MWSFGAFYYVFSIILSLFPLFLGIIWSFYQYKNRKVLSLARKLPTMKPTLPILGHLHYLHGSKGHRQKFVQSASEFIMKTSLKAASDQTNQFCLWIGPQPFITIQNPEDIQVVLNSSKTLNKGSEYDLIRFVVGDGLLTASEHIWKETRRNTQPLFHPRNLEHLVPVLNDQGRKLVTKVSKNVGVCEVNMLPEILPLTLTTLFYLLFGSHSELHPEPLLVAHINKCVLRSFTLWAKRMFHVWLQFESAFKFLYRKDIGYIKQKSWCMTEPAWKAMLQKVSNESHLTEEVLSVKKPKFTFLDALMPLMKKHPEFVKENFEQNLCTMAAAASDTTSITISSCMLVLAWHPDIQDKLCEEIFTMVGKEDKDVTSEDLKSLIYLDQVIKETLRICTVFPILSRKAKENIKLSFGVIPADTIIHIGVQGVHMNPHIYSEPSTFDPDRFLPENVSKRHKFSHLPFSAGPRNCIGKEYAMMSIKTTLVHVLRNYKLSTSADMSDMKFTFALEQYRTNGYPIRLERRIW